MLKGKKIPPWLINVLAPVLATVLLWIGCTGADALLSSRGGPKTKEFLNQTEEEIRATNRFLLEKKTYQIIYDYTISFLDSTIAFDFVPSFDVKGLYNLIRYLPQGAQVNKIEFTNDAVNYYICCQSSEELIETWTLLRNCEQYSSVSFSPAQTEVEKYSGVFCCNFI